MKKEYVIAMGVNAKNSSYKFTYGKKYEVLDWFHKSAEVLDDNGKRCFIAVGSPTLRLENGKFIKATDEVAVAKGWRILKDGEFFQSGGYVKNATISDGQIYASVTPRNEYAELLEQLREILRVPEGESILTHAKVARVLADGLISLQKQK